ncbi:S4-like ribosomal protein [Spraguea lophii 42_110]|uniref:S4-like ribosomal protein n=1 Tax=Spraguea lophii (strain 42_110) TaxID=1358809 RepID=S7XL09_SPRLO|nr:S4-like ribosomal protein [Spraguea lophii 42_110]
MRKLRYHEQRLLRKLNFTNWPISNAHEQQTLSKYYIEHKETYYHYKKLVSLIKKISTQIVLQNKNKAPITNTLINRLYNLNLIKNKKLVDCHKIQISNFCERRLPVVLLRNKMVQNLKDAVRYVQQGHVKIGNNIIRDDNYLVDGNTEAIVQWNKGKIKSTIDKYNDEEDDY